MGKDLLKRCFQQPLNLLKPVTTILTRGCCCSYMYLQAITWSSRWRGVCSSFQKVLSSTSLMCLYGTSKFRNWELWISENCTKSSAFLSSFKFWMLPVLPNSYFNKIFFSDFWKRSDMQYARNNKTSHTRETSQQYFVIKVNGSDSSSDPSWNEGILLLEMIMLPWRHWAFTLTVANVWKFTPVLWRWNFTIFTMNICFLWGKWPKVSPWGNNTSAYAKMSFHTGAHRGETAGTAWVVAKWSTSIRPHMGIECSILTCSRKKVYLKWLPFWRRGCTGCCVSAIH